MRHRTPRGEAVHALRRFSGLIALARGDHALATKRLDEAARTWRRRAAAERPGDRYDPARFTEWWEGMETTSVGDGEFTLQQVGVPELQIPNRLEVRDAGSAIVISCLLLDFVL